MDPDMSQEMWHLIYQFPLLAVALGVGGYFVRYMSKRDKGYQTIFEKNADSFAAAMRESSDAHRAAAHETATAVRDMRDVLMEVKGGLTSKATR